MTLDPSYGEVPGTEAWLKRAEDAEPDEIALVPDEREQARLAVLHAAAEARQAKSPPVPITVVQETEDVAGSTTHKPSAEWAAHHAADAPPDLVLPPPSHAATGSDGDGGHGAAAKPPAVPGSSAVEADKGEGSPTAMKSAVGAEASTGTDG